MSTPRPSGKQPKNCHIDPRSPYWQYSYEYRGKRDRCSTERAIASEAGKWVEKRKVAFRQQVDAERAGERPATARPRITLTQACQRWEHDKHPRTEAEMLNPSIKSWATERGQITLLCALLDGDRWLGDFSPTDFVNYRLERATHENGRGGTIAGATINREIELARRIWKYAAFLEFDIGKEPSWRRYLNKGAEVERKPNLRADDETRLMEALARRNPDLALIAEFSILCAQRKAEVCLLRRRNVDLTGRRATIYLKRRGISPPHSFPLTDRMIEILEAFPQSDTTDQWFTYSCRRNAPARADRPARIAGQRYPFTSQGWQRDWRKALDEAGIKDFRWHDLRHTGATRVVKAVPNLKIAQRLLGHSDISTTARYAHVSDDDVLAAMVLAQG